jgi:alkanesulfonate monooxygenase SsuD/methylene tetrahydromethanopterin reductase-like flavin-dependent oxidoreductase (luciferase family)
LHDIADLDARGIPGGMIATTAFEEAAKAQGKALGFDPAIVYVPHPIQDRTDQELRDIADQALDSVLAMITS